MSKSEGGVPDDLDVRVAALTGSLRDASRTRVAAREALDAAAELGAETDLVDLREFALPPFDADADEPADAAALCERVRAADSVLLGTPVYHGSYSSVLKTALDYCGFDEFENVTVGLLAVAGGRFPVTALDHLRSVMRALDAWVLPHEVAVPRASETVDADGVVDAEVTERLETLGERLVGYAHIEPDPRTFEGGENVGAD